MASLADRIGTSQTEDLLQWVDEKASQPGEWLKRKPRVTHPEILRLVREYVTTCPGTAYDSDVVEYVIPNPLDPLSLYREQIAHEVYIAKGMLKDEENRARLDALIAEGFSPLDSASLHDGDRLLLITETTYVGQSVPTYGEPREVRVKITDSGLWFLPKGARTHGISVSGPALVKDASA